MRPLLPDSHPLLKEEMPVFDFEDADALPYARALSATLIDAMKHYDGIGLAANQIGLKERAFCMYVGKEPTTLFNPLITWLSEASGKLTEGCLSFEGLELTISRPKECQVAYTDENGKRKVIDLNGIEARCALHEIDHLDGVVFTTHVSRLKLEMAKKKAKKLSKKP